MSGMNREIHLASRPQGWPTAENFRLVTTEVPTPGPGQVVVRNRFMSVDPYMRGRMNDVKSYVPPFALDAPLDGGAIGEVVAGEAGGVKPGDTVLHGLGWREYALVDAKGARKIDPDLAPVTAHLGVLGMTGLTAYAGLLDVAAMKPGETVFVSGAAGAVGSMVGQIAKLRGAGRVIGSAGSAAKVERLTALGFDAAFDYHDGPVSKQLRAAAPDGVDVYFDNVGGDHLEAAIGAMNVHGRAAICGMIAQYNATEPPAAPRNLALVIGKRLTLRGFLVSDHGHLREQFVQEVAGWLREGRLSYDETIVDGIEQAPEAFLGLLRGENLGKMLVRL
ncbi:MULTISPECIES: NADP-dependent oxidoreductase [Micromonospora]|uniref:NADP-dependent oxidoreductase n=1 Tax=Micromonospora chalcea TaxID=1874 RepID=A0ABX9YAE3_MICCH|nr:MULTISPECIES: NADP-dependent oxidoreductase [Micromonospora]MBP1784630.1 NADPH-dependent curcumin reductase CurA [Micromonospora sp. HB375]MCK1806287.1 NADP-dependent oxidoreductase [Micromonospora sp. R42106]MCK1831040.1 NADP-dependent oxidoreductase [Micromonospora sp. R42003]MCK1842526.1 NADP-dependent oxidoreductase [Micromonospora sp. R42004]MCM1018668.1 NADP-dependent oxidoreductase [Micromonospora sp. XM-20-01]